MFRQVSDMKGFFQYPVSASTTRIRGDTAAPAASFPPPSRTAATASAIFNWPHEAQREADIRQVSRFGKISSSCLLSAKIRHLFPPGSVYTIFIFIFQPNPVNYILLSGHHQVGFFQAERQYPNKTSWLSGTVPAWSLDFRTRVATSILQW